MPLKMKMKPASWNASWPIWWHLCRRSGVSRKFQPWVSDKNWSHGLKLKGNCCFFCCRQMSRIFFLELFHSFAYDRLLILNCHVLPRRNWRNDMTEWNFQQFSLIQMMDNKKNSLEGVVSFVFFHWYINPPKTNIAHPKVIGQLSLSFLFLWWDMLVPWRV